MSAQYDLLVVTGEHSGEAYAVAVVGALRQRYPQLRIAAMGGELLRQASVDIIQDTAGLDVMGFIPVIKRLPEFLALRKSMAAWIRQHKPRLVLSLDYPGFNIRLAREVADWRAAGGHWIHVVAPQVWAWRPRRAKKIAHSVDELHCFFPFEPKLFNRFKACEAHFVGHPMVDLVSSDQDQDADSAIRALVKPGKKLLLLAPGSRRREVEGVLPILIAAVQRFCQDRAEWQPLICRAPNLAPELFRPAEAAGIQVEQVPYRTALAAAGFAVITSGTATLEAALLGIPHIIVFNGDHLTAKIMRRVLLTQHIGLPNIIHDRRVVPELIQWELTIERLHQRMLRCTAPDRYQQTQEDLHATEQLLGGGGALARIAQLVADRLR